MRLIWKSPSQDQDRPFRGWKQRLAGIFLKDVHAGNRAKGDLIIVLVDPPPTLAVAYLVGRFIRK
jgi:hypothetical protein